MEENQNTIELIEALKKLAVNINPTIIYNEGWMIRLLVIESMNQKLILNGIDFEKLKSKKWSSEALISSPFIKAEKGKREGYTHADIILGDFDVKYEDRGEIKLNDSPKILGIIEAKMRNNLSQKTKNAKNYNQASRSVCCLSHVAEGATKCELFFIVAAPQRTISNNKQIDKEVIKEQIKERFEYSPNSNDYQKIENQVQSCKVFSISYENWIDNFKDNDIKEKLKGFYENCKTYNKIK